MIDHDHWLEAQDEEQSWWGDCVNTYWEEHKQLTYAHYMGLEFYPDHQSMYNLDGASKSILDIGGGPCSLLLKAKNLKSGLVIDPCKYPDWVYDRYNSHGLDTLQISGEQFELDLGYEKFDEVWMYNVLQHTEDPRKIIENGFKHLRSNGVFRVFEWVNTPVNEAHPISLTKDSLDEWFNGNGSVVALAAEGCYGDAYYGVFRN